MADMAEKIGGYIAPALGKPSPFDYEGAKKEGYTDDDIIAHLNPSGRFQVEQAVKAGYSKEEIAKHLAQTSAPKHPWQQFTEAQRMGQPIKGGAEYPGVGYVPTNKETAIGGGALVASLLAAPAVAAAGMTGLPAALTAAGARTAISAAEGAALAPEGKGAEAALTSGGASAAMEAVPYAAKVLPTSLSVGKGAFRMVRRMKQLGESGEAGSMTPQMTQEGWAKPGYSYFDTTTGKTTVVPPVPWKPRSVNTGLPTKEVPLPVSGESGKTLYHEHTMPERKPSKLGLPTSGKIRALLERGVTGALAGRSGGSGEEADVGTGQEAKKEEPEPEQLSAIQQWRASKFGKGMTDPNFQQFQKDMKSKGVRDEEITAMWHQLNYGGPTKATVR